MYDRRVASVLVTADMRQTDTSDRSVDVMLLPGCNARSLEGGALIVTPLVGGHTVLGSAQGVVQRCASPQHAGIACIAKGGTISR